MVSHSCYKATLLTANISPSDVIALYFLGGVGDFMNLGGVGDLMPRGGVGDFEVGVGDLGVGGGDLGTGVWTLDGVGVGVLERGAGDFDGAGVAAGVTTGVAILGAPSLASGITSPCL